MSYEVEVFEAQAVGEDALDAYLVEKEYGMDRLQKKIDALREQIRVLNRTVRTAQKKQEAAEKKLKAKTKELKDSQMGSKNFENNLEYEKNKLKEEKLCRSIAEEKLMVAQVEKENAEAEIEELQQKVDEYHAIALQARKLTLKAESEKEAAKTKLIELEKEKEAHLKEKETLQSTLTSKDEEIARLHALLNAEKEKNDTLTKKTKELETERDEALKAKESLQADSNKEKTKKTNNTKVQNANLITDSLIKAIELADPAVSGSDQDALRIIEQNKIILKPRYLHRIYTNDKGIGGQRILITAVRKNCLAIADQLLQCGANVNIAPGGKADHGYTCLHHAVINRNHEMIKLLLRQPLIDVNVVDNIGKTPMHYAVKNEDAQSIKLILEKKPKLNIKDNKNLTAMDVAKGCSAPIQALFAPQNQASPGMSIPKEPGPALSQFVQQAMNVQEMYTELQKSSSNPNKSILVLPPVSIPPSGGWNAQPGRTQTQQNSNRQSAPTVGIFQPPKNIHPSEILQGNNSASITGKRSLPATQSESVEVPKSKKQRVSKDDKLSPINLTTQPQGVINYAKNSSI